MFGFRKMDRVVKRAMSTYLESRKKGLSEVEARIHLLKTCFPETADLSNQDFEKMLKKIDKMHIFPEPQARIKATIFLVLSQKFHIRSSLDEHKAIKKIESLFDKM